MIREEILQQLSSLKPELEQRYNVTRIGLFGSFTRNQANEESDIDIVVDMQPNLLKRISLKAELEEKFGKKVDVIRYWQGMNHYLKKRIDQEAFYV